MLQRKHPERAFKHLITMPFIWANLIWLVAADFILELYHFTSFPIYKIPLVKRKKYIRIDRHKLSYLSFWEKVGCVYCGYANGWLAYASEIAAQTEKYWCGIKHQNVNNFIQPKHHEHFIDYGDEKAFIEKYSVKKAETIESYQEEK